MPRPFRTVGAADPLQWPPARTEVLRMGDLYGPLSLVLFVALAAALYIWNFVRDERERKRVVQYCAAMGWRYTGEDDSFAYRWSQAPFGVGDRRRARNVVRGTDHDVPFVVPTQFVVDGAITKISRSNDGNLPRRSPGSLECPTRLPRSMSGPVVTKRSCAG